jgi:anti-sigma B factor antagonist
MKKKSHSGDTLLKPPLFNQIHAKSKPWNTTGETMMELKGIIEGDDVLVIEFREDNLDASNVREFKDAVQSVIHDRKQVVLDMSGVKFVDSSGLGALISCLRLLNSRRGDFKLCAMSKTVRALFELMRMHRVFNIHDSRQEAVRAFA